MKFCLSNFSCANKILLKVNDKPWTQLTKGKMKKCKWKSHNAKKTTESWKHSRITEKKLEKKNFAHSVQFENKNEMNGKVYLLLRVNVRSKLTTQQNIFKINNKHGMRSIETNKIFMGVKCQKVGKGLLKWRMLWLILYFVQDAFWY